ncbi:hypothetical protein C8R45DRAFT_298070 [Mycena sanguinolenta]|nr:hypothetical protein C8R45DRAFT_298070 [Mycena sanguinolenta]
MTDGPMPLLRGLEFTTTGFDVSFELRDAPQLRQVVLSGSSLDVALPWQQLTYLNMGLVSQAQCASILQQATNLIHFDVFLDRPSDETSPHITLPSLESLVLRMLHPSDSEGPEFLDTLIVPALRRLEIMEDCIGPDPIGYLTSFIAKSRCPVRILHIGGRRTISSSAYRFAFPTISVSVLGDYLRSDKEHSEGNDEESEGDEVESGSDEDEDVSESEEFDHVVEGDSGSSDDQNGSDSD